MVFILRMMPLTAYSNVVSFSCKNMNRFKPVFIPFMGSVSRNRIEFDKIVITTTSITIHGNNGSER